MKKILVIESESPTQENLLNCLEFAGFDGVGVSSSSKGIQIAREWQPHLILCNPHMPEFDGFDILVGLRQSSLTVTIPCIFLTAQETKVEYRRAMELGADDYLSQSCTTEELLNAIRVRLERQAKLEQCYAVVPDVFPDGPSPIADQSDGFPEVSALLQPVFDFLDLHYAKDIGLKDVAKSVGYSHTYLTHIVRKQTGQSIYAWLTQRRMRAASSLLIETDRSVDEIARSVGYSNVCSFFRQFRQQYGKTPKAWRNENSDIKRNTMLNEKVART